MFSFKNNKKKNNHIPKTKADSIPFSGVYENGIFELTPGLFSKSYRLPEINFRLSIDEQQEKTARMYGEFLGIFEPDTDIEITAYNSSIDIDTFQQDVLKGMRADGLDLYREEYNDMLIDKMAIAKNNMMTEKFLTISIHEKSIVEAVENFARIDSTVSELLSHITEKEVLPMSTEERLSIFNGIYKQDSSQHLYQERKIGDQQVTAFSLENCARQGISPKDVIAPDGDMIFGRQESVIGESFVKSYTFSNYPSWLKVTVLSDFEVLPYNYLFSLHFRSIPRDEATLMLKRSNQAIRNKIYNIQKNTTKSFVSADLISPDLKDSKEESDKMRRDLSKEDERLFLVTSALSIFAESKEELKNAEKQAKMFANQNLLTLSALSSIQQEMGFNTSLPLGYNQLPVDRLMQTESVSALIPFSVKEIKNPEGRYYGQNAISHNMVLYDRINGAPNPAAVIMGVPGSGKTFMAKKEIVDVVLSTQDEIYVLDPEGEYVELCEKMHGSVFHISNGGKYHINPFDIDLDSKYENKSPLSIKTDYIIGLCDIIVGGRYGLSPIEITIIGRVCQIMYEDHIRYLEESNKSYDAEKNPIMKDFYEIMLSQPEPEAKTIALTLERFVSGTYDLFSHHTNIDISKRFVVYDILDIGSGLKEMGLYIAFGHIWDKMISNRRAGKRTWIYTDEFHHLMGNKTSAFYISEIWKRARKWDGVPTAITQNVEDMLKSADARTVINNSNFKILMGQSDINRVQLSELLGISPMEQKYISSNKPGMGLLQINNDFIPVNDSFPKDTELYKLMSTKPQEKFEKEVN